MYILQVIHNLSMWTAADKAITYDQVKSDAKHAKKDIKMVSRGNEHSSNRLFSKSRAL